jgi:hypothetical protein
MGQQQQQQQHNHKQRGSLDVLTSAGGEHGSVAGRLASTGQVSTGAPSTWGGDIGLIDDDPSVARGTAGVAAGVGASRGPSVASLGPQGEGLYHSTAAGTSPVRAVQGGGTPAGGNTPRGAVSAAAHRLFQSFISLASLGSVTLGRGGGGQESGVGGEGALGHALREVHLVNGDGECVYSVSGLPGY